ncbi:MAG: isoprenylcysteine carboxylmethyltransferase family protein [Chlorobium sp.]|jgi:protein-S-isoprenylcysteine O-methyltransferase Ste14|nr:MAG: isoprenylcysteine carboxylmethyltransferase family protein [Chlorobium sp.]
MKTIYKTTSPKSKLPWGKKGEHLVVLQFVLLITFIFLPVYPVCSDSKLFKMLTVLRWTVLSISWIIAAIFLTLGLEKIKHSLTPLPYPVDHNQLVTTGIYAYVRHPLYSCFLFASFGWAVFQVSLSHLIMTALCVLFFSYKAAREEVWLTERHPEYAEYKHLVKKFIPWIY